MLYIDIEKKERSMRNRLHFRIIGILIAVALTGVIAFQAFWLNGLYHTLYHQMEANVREAMRLADYKELFYRMQELKEKNEEGTREFSRNIPFGSQAETGESSEEEANFIQNDVNLNLEDVDLNTQIEEVLTELLHTLGNMEGIILQGMHDEVDPLVPINYQRYDSLLVSELKEKNIDTRYQLYLVYELNEEHSVFQSLGKNHPGMEIDTTAAAIDWQGGIYYDYPIMLNRHAEYTVKTDPAATINYPYYYRLYIKTPASIVLHQMLGILMSSLMVLVIILTAFIYLLRTIMRQKTEKELKEDFTNNMTHELKTPISVSYAAVDSLLYFSDQVDEKQRKYLTIVKEQLTHLTGLVEQILTLSVENRSSFRLRLEPIGLSPFIHQMIEQYKVKTRQNTHFTVDIPEDLTVTADKTHLYNIFSNLIDNAIKYADKEISEITLVAEHTEKGIHIRLTDNGPGISPAHQGRIFDKFYRIPSGNLHDVKGHGLGLYYVKDMMIKHEGDVTLESLPGKGSTFHLKFKG